MEIHQQINQKNEIDNSHVEIRYCRETRTNHASPKRKTEYLFDLEVIFRSGRSCVGAKFFSR